MISAIPVRSFLTVDPQTRSLCRAVISQFVCVRMCDVRNARKLDLLVPLQRRSDLPRKADKKAVSLAEEFHIESRPPTREIDGGETSARLQRTNADRRPVACQREILLCG